MVAVANMVAPLMFTQSFALAVGRYRALNLPGAPYLLAALSLLASLLVSQYATRD